MISAVRMCLTFLMHFFSKCSPLFPIYVPNICSMFFSCLGASLQILFNTYLRIYLRKSFHDMNFSVSSISFFSKHFELHILEAQTSKDLKNVLFCLQIYLLENSDFYGSHLVFIKQLEHRISSNIEYKT